MLFLFFFFFFLLLGGEQYCHIYSVIRPGFMDFPLKNKSKNLDPSYKMDLDFLGLFFFGRVKPV